MLNKLDIRIRKFVREILHLPLDVPTPVFHASVTDGERLKMGDPAPGQE